MSTFILVSGPFTDGRVWSEVAERLRESGAGAHPVTPSRQPGADLETHVEDVIRLIDLLRQRAPREELVLVGHGYGIHPVLGAADRRAERIARIVHLDAGMPQDGDAALALVPDPSAHELLSAQGDSGPLPPPAPAQWERWGSTEGLSAHQLDLLSRLAAPQPRRTLTQPLRLTGAAAAVPSSGILCTAGGTTLELVEALVRTGPPQFRKLADPRVGFFELATGHWPMLSCPDELAGVLIRAAAGEGRRLTVPEGEPPFLGSFLLDVPQRPRVRIGRVDLHLPEPGDAGGPRPAVLFVHGGPVPADLVPAPRDTPFYLGYARLAASLGAVGAVVEHRLHGVTDYAQAADDVTEALEILRADPRVDARRIGLWIFSGAGPLAADWLGAPPPWLRCLALTYPILAPLPGWGAVGPRFRPVDALRADGAAPPPLVLTRAGLETPLIAATVARFTAAARETKAPLEVVDVPNGRHGFELHGPTDESREAVSRAVRTVVARLDGAGVSP
ncbi:dienelactone hydrolase [Streptomyces sp. V3I8]|uniref:alpha/beta hydrolase n=1 Tax=Streptomyces sp. V3I8 TaxID=3042279 RepID=UPI002784309F|nr:alpha/beta hydrolase [Streptomyces sp. V3I8]MDQ1040510.1 dienelactone hydrolase [Streptomyces sp. V3I8]